MRHRRKPILCFYGHIGLHLKISAILPCFVGYPFIAPTPDELEEEFICPRFSENTPIYLTVSKTFALSVDKLNAYLYVLRRHPPLPSREHVELHY